MRGTQANLSFGGFAGEQPLLGGFNAVVHRVAQQVHQGRFELFQHVTVHLGFLAFNFQADLFAQAAPQITHHALLPGQHIGERAHAAGQRRVIQQLRTLTGVPAKLVQLCGLLSEHVLRLGQ